MSMSTPINQIRSMHTSGNTAGVLPPELMPQVQSSQPGQQLISPIYNPNVDLSPATISNSQLVDDILKEMDTRPVPGANHMMDVNVGNINYSMDPSAHIPPERNPNAQRIITGTEDTQMPSMATYQHINLSGDESMRMDDESLLLYQRIIKEAKPALLVFILVLVLSLHQTNRLIFGFFPNLILENGELSIYAILLRATIASVLFYLLHKFLPF